MKRVGNLFDPIVSFENLLIATRRTVRGRKSKNSVARFYLDYEKEILDLQSELIDGRYELRPFVEFTIYEPKERKICSAPVRDRVVHHAICRVIEPFLERRLIHDTYACRTGKGSHLAIKRCQRFARRYRYFLKCDIAKYFESIDPIVLKNILGRLFKDRRLLDFLGQIIDHRASGLPEKRGLPIGNLTSQHFANLYLGELDHFVKETLRIPGYLRYMDDFILFHDSKEALASALEFVKGFVENKLRLSLKDKITTLAPVHMGVPFLGVRVFSEVIRIQRKNLIRIRQKIVRQEKYLANGQISEEELYRSINSVVAHISHANVTLLLRKEVIRSLKMA